MKLFFSDSDIFLLWFASRIISFRVRSSSGDMFWSVSYIYFILSKLVPKWLSWKPRFFLIFENILLLLLLIFHNSSSLSVQGFLFLPIRCNFTSVFWKVTDTCVCVCDTRFMKGFCCYFCCQNRANENNCYIFQKSKDIILGNNAFLQFLIFGKVQGWLHMVELICIKSDIY